MTRKIAFISGVFDGSNGLHAGHRLILSKMRELTSEGTYVIVSINSDAYAARKGPGRPLTPLEGRRAALYSSGLVDEVIAIEDSPLEVIKALKPDFICVGRADYTPEQVVGFRECGAWGGEVVVIEEDLGVSTTQMVEEKSKTNIQ
jgi:D-beta-D-heptose 7-phosphate kinase/D-beta-D-heptose 1-phosphate adenosyltransferase